jgi:hypothetical protein
VIIGFVIFFFCLDGWGADWKFIGKDDPGSVWEVDVASISRQPNNIVRVWVKITYSKEYVSYFVKDFRERYKDLSHVTLVQNGFWKNLCFGQHNEERTMINLILPLNTLSLGLLRAYKQSFGLVILDSKINTQKKE